MYIIVLNVHVPCEDKSDDVMDSFYEELGRVFDQFPRYDLKILLGGCNAKVGRKDIVISSQVLFTMDVYYTQDSIHNC
jgi:hypothetical protein